MVRRGVETSTGLGFLRVHKVMSYIDSNESNAEAFETVGWNFYGDGKRFPRSWLLWMRFAVWDEDVSEP